jgi:hypothetical protein
MYAQNDAIFFYKAIKNRKNYPHGTNREIEKREKCKEG